MFAGTPVIRIGKHHLLISTQQAVSLGHIVDVGRCSNEVMHPPEIGADTNVRLHAEVPLVALLDLMHHGVSLTRAVLGGDRCSDENGVHHGAAFEQQTMGG